MNRRSVSILLLCGNGDKKVDIFKEISSLHRSIPTGKVSWRYFQSHRNAIQVEAEVGKPWICCVHPQMFVLFGYTRIITCYHCCSHLCFYLAASSGTHYFSLHSPLSFTVSVKLWGKLL